MIFSSSGANCSMRFDDWDDTRLIAPDMARPPIATAIPNMCRREMPFGALMMTPRSVSGFVPRPLERRRRAVGSGAVGLDVHHLPRMAERLVGKAIPEPVTHRSMQGGGPVEIGRASCRERVSRSRWAGR